MNPFFHDRRDTGRLLATSLAHYSAQPDLLVLGLARGGVPVAAEIARALKAPLDVLVVRKLGVPHQPELAMGAIAPGGVCALNDALVDQLGIERDAIGVVRQREERELERRERVYRGERPPPEVRGKTVIVVDDGVATGSTMHAAVVYLHRREAARVVVAAPVMARDSQRELAAIADEVVAIITPPVFHSVGQWFDNFSPTSDDEVRRALRRVRDGRGEPD